MTNTDSSLYQVEDTKSDLYLVMMDCMHLWVTSDYPSDHLLHSNENKNVLCKFKDETNGNQLKTSVAKAPNSFLRSSSGYFHNIP